MLKREMHPVHPGAILKEMYLEPLALSITEFADNIGVTRKTVSQIVNEHSGISAEMALRLSEAFNTTPEMWLDMQQKYDLWEAKKNVKLFKIKHLIIKTKSVPETTILRGSVSAEKTISSRDKNIATKVSKVSKKKTQNKATKQS